MRRLLLPLVVILSGALLAACGSSSTRVAPAPAATVNDGEISSQALFDQLDAVAAVPEYGGAFGLQSDVSGASPGTFDTTASASVLNTLVIFELVEQEVAELGLEVTPDDLAAADQQVASLLGSIDPLGQTDEEFGAEQAAQVSEAARQPLVDAIAAVTVLQTELAGEVTIAEVTDEQVREFYDQNTDAVGDATFEEVAEEIRAALEEEAARQAQEAADEPFSTWLQETLLSADVDVDPRFGRWAYVISGAAGIEEVDSAEGAQSAGVLPPEGPQSPPTTAPLGVEPLVPAPG